jgi:hypothetical protein
MVLVYLEGLTEEAETLPPQPQPFFPVQLAFRISTRFGLAFLLGQLVERVFLH